MIVTTNTSIIENPLCETFLIFVFIVDWENKIALRFKIYNNKIVYFNIYFFGNYMEQYLLYALVIWVVGFLWRGMKAGSSKLMKIIFWNYLMWILCITLGILLQNFVTYLNQTPDLDFLWIKYSSYANFIADIDAFLLVGIYLILLVIWTQKSRISIHLPDSGLGKVLWILLIPLAVAWILLTLILVVYGENIQWIQSITINNQFINSFVWDFAMWMLIQTWIVFTLSLNFENKSEERVNVEDPDRDFYEEIRREINQKSS